MKIAVFGATGRVGSRIVAEALQRGHHVTGISPHSDKLAARPNLTLETGDVNDRTAVVRLVAGHDAVVSSVKFVMMKPRELIEAMKQTPVKRLLVVGGAASLYVAPGEQLADTPDFPESYKPEAFAGRDFLNLLRGEIELEWTFLSPSAELVPGKRTEKFRLGNDELLTAPDGSSSISMEDFAMAMIDEIEMPMHVRARFTVGY